MVDIAKPLPMGTVIQTAPPKGVAQSVESVLHSDLPGVNVLLMGPAGTGKTYACGTLADINPDLEVFYFGLEPGLESLLGYWTDRGLEVPPNVHWHVLKGPKASFQDMLDNATKINTLSLSALASLQDPKRASHNTYLLLLSQLSNFQDQRTGENFGMVDSWGTNRVLIMDGMSGLNRAAMSLVVGGKPVISQGDWGIAQGMIENVLNKLTKDCACHFVLISHVERETDAVLGGIKIMLSTLGKKLAPKLPSMFSDVVMAVREGTKYTWDTASPLADVKTRNLATAANLPPSFQPILDKWKSRGGKFTPMV